MKKLPVLFFFIALAFCCHGQWDPNGATPRSLDTASTIVQRLVALGGGTNYVISLTNIISAITNENPNELFVSGGGTAAANGKYVFQRNAFTSGWVFTNVSASAFLCKDLTGPDETVGEENPYFVGPTTNNDHTAWYYSSINERAYWQNSHSIYGAMAGSLPLPTVRYGTNVTCVTNTVIVQTGFVDTLKGSKVLLVDALHGNDTGACLGLCPYRTLTAAKNAASAGWTIVVNPGTYNEHDLLKTGVNWEFLDGTVLNYDEPLWGDGRGIFDDRGLGAITSNITGDVLRYSSTGPAGGVAILVTHNLSKLNINFKRADVAFYAFIAPGSSGLPTFVGNPGVCSVINCQRVDITVGEVANRSHGAVTLIDANQNAFSTYGQAKTYNAGDGGFYWVQGEEYITVDTMLCTNGNNYFLWSDTPGTVTSETSVFFRGHFVNGFFYGDGASTSSRTWLNIDYLKGHPGAGTALRFYGNSLYYVTAQKVSVPGGNVIDTGGGSYTFKLWAYIEKLSSDTGKWLNLSGPCTTFIDVLNFESTQGSANPISISGGTNYIRGVYAQTSGGPLVNFSGGSTTIEGLTADASRGSQSPVSIAANGLRLKGCTLIAPMGVNSITSGSAHTFDAYWSAANESLNGNVTVGVNAGWTVNSNVR